MLDVINKELSGKLDQCYLSNKLFFGKQFININFNVYSLYFFFLVIQFYDCTLDNNPYWLSPTIVWLRSLTCQNWAWAWMWEEQGKKPDRFVKRCTKKQTRLFTPGSAVNCKRMLFHFNPQKDLTLISSGPNLSHVAWLSVLVTLQRCLFLSHDCKGSSYNKLQIRPTHKLLAWLEMNTTQKLSAAHTYPLATVCITRKESYATGVAELPKNQKSHSVVYACFFVSHGSLGRVERWI